MTQADNAPGGGWGCMLLVILGTALVVWAFEACSEAWEQASRVPIEREPIERMPDGASAAFVREMERAVEDPCGSRLVFVRRGGEWYLTCPGCVSRPAASIYPVETIRQLEEAATKARVTLTELMQWAFVCP
ncbi:MAG: hypothetical protein OXC11_14375 [Rhodospirillales bacterium]|nr:hypothetical protein [Rhodospirillales bacterium]